jgi:hypothetical protein
LPQRDDEAEEFAALLGEGVLVVGAAVGGGHDLEDACADQVLETRGEDVPGQPQAALATRCTTPTSTASTRTGEATKGRTGPPQAP